MNISRFLVGALVLCTLPVLAQPDIKPANGLPYPLVSPADAAKIGQMGKPIALHLRDVTLGEALKQLQEQSGVALDTSWGAGMGILEKKLSLDIETNSFSEAFRAVLDEADVKARLERPDGGVWQVIFGQTNDSAQGPQSGTASFPIRLVNLRSNLSKTVTLGKDQAPRREQNTSLNVTLAAVPNQQLPLIGSPRVRVTRAEDEQGRSLTSQTPGSFSFGYGGMSQPIDVPLRSPQAGSQKLAHLEGVAVYVLFTKRDKWEVPDVLNAKGASHIIQSGGETITASIQNVQKKGAGIQVDFQLKGAETVGFGTPQNPLISFDQLRSSLYLVDAQGQRLAAGGSSGHGSNNQLDLQVEFSPVQRRPRPVAGKDGKPVVATPETPALAEPVKMVFDAPTEFVQTEVPFSFSDLPLP